MKNSFNKVKNFFIKKIEGLGFIKRSAKRWQMKPRGAIYVYLTAIAMAIGIAFLGFIIYAMVFLCRTTTGFDLVIVIIGFVAFEILILMGVFLLYLNIFNLLNGQPSYVDYLLENDQRRFARRRQHYPE